MQKGPRAPLSAVESRQLASVMLRATAIFVAVLVTVLMTYGCLWYFAFPIALFVAWLFMTGSVMLVAYQKRAAPPDTGQTVLNKTATE